MVPSVVEAQLGTAMSIGQYGVLGSRERKAQGCFLVWHRMLELTTSHPAVKYTLGRSYLRHATWALVTVVCRVLSVLL